MKSENSVSLLVNFFQTKQVDCKLSEKHFMGFEDDLQETIRCTLNLPNEKETVRFGLLRRGIEKLSVNTAI